MDTLLIDITRVWHMHQRKHGSLQVCVAPDLSCAQGSEVPLLQRTLVLLLFFATGHSCNALLVLGLIFHPFRRQVRKRLTTKITVEQAAILGCFHSSIETALLLQLQLFHSLCRQGQSIRRWRCGGGRRRSHRLENGRFHRSLFLAQKHLFGMHFFGLLHSLVKPDCCLFSFVSFNSCCVESTSPFDHIPDGLICRHSQDTDAPTLAIWCAGPKTTSVIATVCLWKALLHARPHSRSQTITSKIILTIYLQPRDDDGVQQA